MGDTITHIARPCDKAIAGFEEVKPMVFAGVYPIEAEDFEDLRASLEKLQLNDASLTFQPESSLALGFGFRCGFLGLLHMEIVQERLDREFDMNVITTVPNVSYHIYDKQGNMKEVHNLKHPLMTFTNQTATPSSGMPATKAMMPATQSRMAMRCVKFERKTDRKSVV